jgi:hypothetical protein
MDRRFTAEVTISDTNVATAPFAETVTFEPGQAEVQIPMNGERVGHTTYQLVGHFHGFRYEGTGNIYVGSYLDEPSEITVEVGQKVEVPITVRGTAKQQTVGVTVGMYDESIARVSPSSVDVTGGQGTVTVEGVNPGTTTLQVSSLNPNLSASITVIVKPHAPPVSPPSSAVGFGMKPNPETVRMSFSPSSTSPCKGNSFQADFRITVSPDGAKVTIDQPGNAAFGQATGTINPDGRFQQVATPDGSYKFQGKLNPDGSGNATFTNVSQGCTYIWNATWSTGS